ncbi:MAG TPA: ferritin-like domain-containing protein [Cyclobacteriaceae bacterium]|nr:ferritin-like domain-containing protein [Cyclobacteriaceae bacterium]
MATKSKSNEKMHDSKFHELFVEELKDIYWAESHLAKALPKMAKAATTPELTKAIENHTKETEEHVKRLEKVFEHLGLKASGKKCPAMEGLLEEGKEVIEDTKSDSMVRDAGIIIGSQKIEHYEIAAYGSLAALAKKMGHKESLKLLEQTLEEEKKTDSLLTQIAEEHVNEEAAKE